MAVSRYFDMLIHRDLRSGRIAGSNKVASVRHGLQSELVTIKTTRVVVFYKT
ncbi:hypothetical protein BN2497_11303 [Janthinobacterium sp. CG23_2]|nr:hypothetical protein BN2497_11303 [Janthinobacterium sp. CG23_2]CUU32049.1 hypothetical protein BN3177_11303 [Janthinobacterium sp. CG23_2]